MITNIVKGDLLQNVNRITTHTTRQPNNEQLNKDVLENTSFHACIQNFHYINVVIYMYIFVCLV